MKNAANDFRQEKAALADGSCVYIDCADNGDAYVYGVWWLKICVMLILQWVTLLMIGENICCVFDYIRLLK